jgi:GxxExxY protein
MREMNYREDRLTGAIIQAIIRVHTVLGPGLLEGVYEKALVRELLNRAFRVETEKVVAILYDGQEVGIHRLDIVVEETVIVECKTVEALGRIHYAQPRSYLKATGLTRGILVNFDAEMADYRRVTPND